MQGMEPSHARNGGGHVHSGLSVLLCDSLASITLCL